MNTWNDRLRAARDARAVTSADLARACKVSTASVANWFNGKTKNLRPDNLFRACDYLAVSPRWVATGRGDMEPRGFDAGLDVQLWLDCESALDSYINSAQGAEISRRDQIAILAEMYGQALNADDGKIDDRAMVFAVGVILRSRSVSDASNGPRRASKPRANSGRA